MPNLHSFHSKIWSERLKITAADAGGVLVVTVVDRRLDAAVAKKFKEMMIETIKDRPDRIILDLTQVEFLDSSGLGAMVGSLKYLGRDREIDLAGLTTSVEKIFRITRMDKVFRLFPSVDSALNAE